MTDKLIPLNSSFVVKKCFVVTLVSNLLVFSLYSQESAYKSLDSLEQLYLKNIYNVPDDISIRSIKRFSKAVEDSKTKDAVYHQKKGNALKELILLYAREQKFDSARYYYNYIIRHYDDKQLRIFAHQKRALVEYFDLNHDKALYYYDKAIEEAELHGETEEKIKVWIDLSIFYRYAEDFESAQTVFEELQAHIDDSLPVSYLFSIQYEDVYLKFHRKQYQDALQTLSQIDTTGLHQNSIYFRGYHEAYVDAFIHLKQYDSALYYNDIAVHHKHSTPSFSPIDDYTYYANIYHKKGEFEKALGYLNTIKDTSAVNNTNYSLKDFHELSYKIHKSLGNVELAFTNYEKYHTIKSKIDDEIKTKQADIIKYKLNKDRTINALKLSQAKAKQKQQQKFYSTLIFFTVFLTVLGILFFVYKQKHKRKHLVIEQARKLDELKNQYLENISHEIRTPLTLIRGITQGIKKNKGKLSTQNISQLEQNTSALLNMVNQILDLRKLDSKELKLNLAQSDVIPYLKLVVDSFQYVALQKDISLTLETGLESQVMDFDAEKLKFIMSNLISNAIKFTPKGGQIKVIISKATDENLIQICVEDNGIGISESDQKYIFNRFYQAKSSTNGYNEGFGIGLHFTQQLVNLMQGDIAINSIEDEGTTVRVQLPVKTSEAINTKAHTEDFDAITHPDDKENVAVLPTENHLNTILIVEDNPAVQSLLSEQLSGYHIRVANDGEEGLKLALKIVPDLIVSDVMMPKKDGYALCKAVKTNKTTSHIPVILLTAKADQKSKIEGLSQKADAYISKPYDVEELLLSIKNLIESRKALQEVYKNLHETSPTTNQPLEDVFINQIKQHVLNNIENESFGIEELCAILNISRTGLHNKIKALTGLPITGFVNYIKLQKAKDLMLNTTLNNNEISIKTGFNTYQYFSTKFKEEFGISPKKFRDNMNNKDV